MPLPSFLPTALFTPPTRSPDLQTLPSTHKSLETVPNLNMVITKEPSSQLEWLSTLSASFNPFKEEDKFLRKVSEVCSWIRKESTKGVCCGVFEGAVALDDFIRLSSLLGVVLVSLCLCTRTM